MRPEHVHPPCPRHVAVSHFLLSFRTSFEYKGIHYILHNKVCTGPFVGLEIQVTPLFEAYRCLFVLVLFLWPFFILAHYVISFILFDNISYKLKRYEIRYIAKKPLWYPIIYCFLWYVKIPLYNTVHEKNLPLKCTRKTLKFGWLSVKKLFKPVAVKVFKTSQICYFLSTHCTFCKPSVRQNYLMLKQAAKVPQFKYDSWFDNVVCFGSPKMSNMER